MKHETPPTGSPSARPDDAWAPRALCDEPCRSKDRPRGTFWRRVMGKTKTWSMFLVFCVFFVFFVGGGVRRHSEHQNISFFVIFLVESTVEVESMYFSEAQ